MSKDTLGVHLSQFTKKERLALCFIFNQTDLMDVQVHLGLLPFIGVDKAILACARSGSFPSSRVQRQIFAKLKHIYQRGDGVEWVMYLSPLKVARRFGAHPERGHKIQYASKKRVTVGVRWCLPKKDYEPDDDVLVAPHVALRCVGKDTWLVSCEKRYRPMVTQYLTDHCV